MGSKNGNLAENGWKKIRSAIQVKITFTWGSSILLSTSLRTGLQLTRSSCHFLSGHVYLTLDICAIQRLSLSLSRRDLQQFLMRIVDSSCHWQPPQNPYEFSLQNLRGYFLTTVLWSIRESQSSDGCSQRWVKWAVFICRDVAIIADVIAALS